METIFYNELFIYDNLTPNEKIIYSFLIYKSIPLIDCAFNSDSELDVDSLIYSVDDYDYIGIYDIGYRKIAKELCISERATINSITSLKRKGLISKDGIHLNKRIIHGGYFKLYTEMGIKGELLIFYSYIKSKSIYFGGCIDTFKYKLAIDTGLTKIAVTNLLNRLYKLNLAERLPDGRLKVN